MKAKILYLAASQFSGSTLTSFLLNTHPDITTVGHTTGWNFAADEAFHCSCGALLEDCPFYAAISEAFAREGLPFDIRNFGTAYTVARNDRLNRLLTAGLPRLQSTTLERLRDGIVTVIPGIAGQLRQRQTANRVFIETALARSGATVFLDNSHDPYRMRHLAANDAFDVLNLHLVRDPRGMVLSSRKNSGWNATNAMQAWLRRQADIVRISREARTNMVLHYETLCEDANAALARVHDFAGLGSYTFSGDFKQGEHHILGNQMRLRDGKIRPDTRWQTDLGADDTAVIVSLASAYVRQHSADDGVSRLLEHYLGNCISH